MTQKRLGVGEFGTRTSMCIGVVRNNADPAQHGRLQVWIPSIDSTTIKTDDLPWASYVSPFGGSTADFKVGREQETVPGGSSYGFWAIPKNGAQVLVGFLEGDPMVRFWMGCFYIPELNRTLPQAVNTENGPTSELDESGLYPQTVIPHMQKNLTESGLGPGTENYKTRGGFERSVSHPSNNTKDKPRDDGYATNPIDPEHADSQTISLTTPGRHFISMSDVDDHCRIRFKTTAGTQIILDDTNERIYISTAQGRNWIEFDEGSGKIYMYSSSKINVHSDNDINFSSDENINIVAKKRVNIVSEERGIKLQSKMGLQFLSSGGDIKITASRSIHLKTTGGGNSGGVGESSSCNSPPYSGGPLGLVRDYSEEGGSGESSVFINASQTIEAKADGGSIHLNANGSIDALSSSSINLDAGGTLNLMASAIATSADDVLGMYAGEVDQAPVYSYFDASGAAGAADGTAVNGEDVKSKMIVPKHESWKRDEDEAQCKTPRNKKYQG
jgi:hypothetical protein